MPSPFPGMNPYLERAQDWHDFHQRFIPAIAVALGGQVRPKYHVRVDESVYIHELSDDRRILLGRPDISIVDRAKDRGTTATLKSAAAPAYGFVPPKVDVVRESFLSIVDLQTNDVVTVIELLSPSNKSRKEDREQYEAKRRQLLHSDVNFIEIDLLRGGGRLPVTGLPDCDYYIMVSRVEERPRVGLWPILLKELLPTVPIPVRAGDAYASLNLQQVLNRVYDEAGYADYIYDRTPEPPLHPTMGEWARQFLPVK
jgi:hypothetical protein